MPWKGSPSFNSFGIEPQGHPIESAIFVGFAIIALVAFGNTSAPLLYILAYEKFLPPLKHTFFYGCLF